VTSTGMLIQQTGSLTLPADPHEPWTLPRRAGDADFVTRLHAMPMRLADWGYEVCTGPLVWNRHKPRLHDMPGPGRVPVIWAEAVTPDGRFVLKATKKNHRAWFEPRDATDSNLVDRPCVLAAFLATDAADRVLRCINASVAVSASELAAVPLPTPESVVAAMDSAAFAQAIRGLYGLNAA